MCEKIKNILFGLLIIINVVFAQEIDISELISDKCPTISISITPPNEKQGRLRSILVHCAEHNLRMEPHARWTDGTYISSDVLVDCAEIGNFIETVKELDCKLYYSTRIPSTTKSPPNLDEVEKYFKDNAGKPGLHIKIIYLSKEADFYIYSIRQIPWGKQTVNVLNKIEQRVTNKDLKDKINSLIESCLYLNTT